MIKEQNSWEIISKYFYVNGVKENFQLVWGAHKPMQFVKECIKLWIYHITNFDL